MVAFVQMRVGVLVGKLVSLALTIFSLFVVHFQIEETVVKPLNVKFCNKNSINVLKTITYSSDSIDQIERVRVKALHSSLCWMNAYEREYEVIQRSPKGCYSIALDECTQLTTYSSHRFLAIPYDVEAFNVLLQHSNISVSSKMATLPHEYIYVRKEDDNSTLHINYIEDLLQSHLQSRPPLADKNLFVDWSVALSFYLKKFSVFSESNHLTVTNTCSSILETKSTNNFLCFLSVISQVTWTGIWVFLLRFRHSLMLFMGTVIVGTLWLGQNTNIKNSDTTLNPRCYDCDKLMLHRHSIKCFAVGTMLLNHFSYAFFDGVWQRLGCLPADIGGSMSLFHWLVGCCFPYKHKVNIESESSQNFTYRNGEIRIIIALLFLEHFIRLPRPYTCETLFSIVIGRLFLNTSWLQLRPENKYGPCRLMNQPIIIHGLLITTLALLHPIFNNQGLRLFHCHSLLYVVSGRMYVSANLAERSSDEDSPMIDSGKDFNTKDHDDKIYGKKYKFIAHNHLVRLLWIGSASYLQLRDAFRSDLLVIASEGNIVQILIGVLICLGATFQMVVLCTASVPYLWQPSSVAQIISKYSLEIYVIHYFAACVTE